MPKWLKRFIKIKTFRMENQWAVFISVNFLENKCFIVESESIEKENLIDFGISCPGNILLF